MIEWEKTFSINYEKIDEQHKELIRLINKIEILLEKSELDEKSFFDEMNIIMDKIIDYTEYHFKTEESLFKKYKYPNADMHISKHEDFILDTKILNVEFLTLEENHRKEAKKCIIKLQIG